MTAPIIHSPKSGHKLRRVGRKPNDIKAFRHIVLSYFKKSGRDLPWRHTSDPYKILVSEVMLQQTQVDRVRPKYTRFLKKFPSLRKLAQAHLGDVLKEWQGLGYNRRAKMLHETAKATVLKYRGTLPRAFDALCELPGIGPYTAHAVRVFAWNEADVLIETNVRTVFIHHFFPKTKKVADEKLMPYIALALPKEGARDWYSALMDYGTYLKSTIGNASRRSAHHTLQLKFKGSDREVRGAILKTLSQDKKLSSLAFDSVRVEKNLAALVREGLIKKRGKGYQLG